MPHLTITFGGRIAAALRRIVAVSPTVRYYGVPAGSTANPLRATFLRGGTSKGVFINRSDLPEDRGQWDRIFLGIMGSPDPDHGRQLNGMGGGVSSLSKICVVGPPSPSQKREGIQAEYTFAQVGIRDSSIDYSGNCGNLSSMIGVFAVDEGICEPVEVGNGGSRGTVRTFNTNTNKIIDTTFPISDKSSLPVLDLPEASVAGVPGKASTIMLEFVNPGGARTGNLLPSGSAINELEILHSHSIRASLIDATNPTVFLSSDDVLSLPSFSTTNTSTLSEISPDGYETLESARQLGARSMGLDPLAQAQPKIAILSSPTAADLAEGVDIVIHALSMGVLHKAVPMTVGLCLGVAANVEGSLAWEIVRRARSHGAVSKQEGLVRIRHPSGIVDVGAEFLEDGTVKSAKVVRTGRRLMKGVVWW